MIITPANVNGLFTAFDTEFNKFYEQAKGKSWADKVAMMRPSKTSENTYAWLDQIPGFREWVGPRVVHNLVTRLYTRKNKKFELTIGVERTIVEDDQYDMYMPAVGMMGAQAGKWADGELATWLQAGTATTNPCYDGLAFFSASHLQGVDAGSTTFSNLFTSRSLTPENYSYVRASMASYLGQDGKPLKINPNQLIVPPQLEDMAKVIVNSSMLAPSQLVNSPTSTQVGANENPYKGTAEVVVIPELANEPTVWYLQDTNLPIRGLIWQLRSAPETTALISPTDPNVFETDQFQWGARARGAAAWGLPYLLARCAA